MKKNERLLACAFFSLLFAHCAMESPVAEDYYAGTGKIAGGNPPSVPVVTFTAAQLRFDFAAAIDPESAAEVSTYFVYVYNGSPSTYYEPRDIALSLAPPTRTFYYTGSKTGTRTVVVTGYDGYRESAVTNDNRVTFSFP